MATPDLRDPFHLVAFGFGAGLAPKAPGTAGTLVAIPLVILFAQLPLYAYVGVVILLFLLGIPLCDRVSRDLGVHDHSGIVWDEIVGLLVTMIAVPVGWTTVVVGFLLFRLFDIIKPWPISWLDRRVKGGLGIMVDDLLAGILAAMCMHGLLALGLL